ERPWEMKWMRQWRLSISCMSKRQPEIQKDRANYRGRSSTRCRAASRSRFRPGLNPASVARRLEISQIRRPLILLGGHQQAIGADHVILVADADMQVVFRADHLFPHWPRIGVTPVLLLCGPRLGEGVVDDRDLVIEDVTLGLVGIESLLDDGLIVG